MKKKHERERERLCENTTQGLGWSCRHTMTMRIIMGGVDIKGERKH